MRRALTLSLVVAACEVQRPTVVAPATTASPPTAPIASSSVSSAPPTAAPILHAGMRVRPLDGAAVPFASYLNAMHNRIHPEFADRELAAMDKLPPLDPLSDIKLMTRIEMVLSATDGHLVKVSVVKASGLTAFDVAVLASVHRAQPFGGAPEAIASADGNVYVEWAFHRDPIMSCSTMHSRPYLLGP